MVIEALTANVVWEFGKKLFLKMDELKPKDVQIVSIKQDPNKYSLTLLDDVSTQDKSEPTKDNPHLEFTNELKKDAVVTEISIIPDDAFKSKGKLTIKIDDVPVFKSKKFGNFAKVSTLNIPINKTIRQQSKVKFFLQSLDGTWIGITASVTLGE